MKRSAYSEYRPSGMMWLEEIPTQWTLRKLKHVASVNFSSVDKHTFENEEPVRLCNYVDVYYNDYITPDLSFMEATASNSEIRRFTLKRGDVLVTKDSEEWNDIAVSSYVVDDLQGVLCGYHLAHIRSNPECMDGKYLFRAFSALGINDQFRVEATGITRYGLGKYGLDNAFFPVPPLETQHAIAAFLNRETEHIDTLIAKKERQIELLQEKRAALISHVVTKGLNPSVKMKDSGIEWLGRIPEHWGIHRVKVIFQEINERSSTGEEELLTVSHITGVTRRSEKNVTMFMAESLEDYKRCKPGDLVINTMWAWMGAMGIAAEAGIVSPSYNVYRFRSNEQEPWFYDYLFRTGKFVAEVICHSQGVWTSRLRLYPEEFFEIRLPCPPSEEQKEIVGAIRKETGNYDVLKNRIEKSIERLLEYRTALISAAVTGKIDVREEVA